MSTGDRSSKGALAEQVLGGLVFFVTASLIGFGLGLFSRQPFDDEAYTLEIIRHMGLYDIILNFSTGIDVHPFFSYFFYKVLSEIGLSDAGLRFVAFQFSVSAAFIVYRILILDASYGLYSKLALQTPFLAVPLLYGAGDGIRWWPLFNLFIVIFISSYLADRRPTPKAALALGFAAASNVLAIIPYGAFFFHRYLMKRKALSIDDINFHVILLIVSFPGILNFMWIYSALNSRMISNFEDQRVQMALKAILGIGGGYRLGPIFAPFVLPYWIAIIGAGALLFFRRRHLSGPAGQKLPLHFGPTLLGPMSSGLMEMTALMSLEAVLLVGGGGFSQARSFIFLTPFLAAVVALAVVHPGFGPVRVRAGLAGLYAFSFVAFVGLYSNDHPFKRNMAIPFAKVMTFIEQHRAGKTLLITNEQVTAYLAENSVDCVWGRVGDQGCTQSGTDICSFQTVIVAGDHLFFDLQPTAQLSSLVRQSFTVVTEADFGEDRDVKTKQEWTGVRLPAALLHLTVYQRRQE